MRCGKERKFTFISWAPSFVSTVSRVDTQSRTKDEDSQHKKLQNYRQSWPSVYFHIWKGQSQICKRACCCCTSLKFFVTEVPSHCRINYNIAGWTLPLKSYPELEKHFIKTLSKCEVRGIPEQGLSYELRGIDWFNENLPDVEKAGSLSGARTKSRAITKPSHIKESHMKYVLICHQCGANHPRLSFWQKRKKQKRNFKIALKLWRTDVSPFKDSFQKFLQRTFGNSHHFFQDYQRGWKGKEIKILEKEESKFAIPKAQRIPLSYEMKAISCRTLDSL